MTLTDEQSAALAKSDGRITVTDPRTGLLVRIERLPAPPAGIEYANPRVGESIAAYKAALPQLLARRRNRGRWVLFDGPEQVAIAADSAELFRLAGRGGRDIAGCHVGEIRFGATTLGDWEEPATPAPDIDPADDIDGGHPAGRG